MEAKNVTIGKVIYIATRKHGFVEKCKVVGLFRHDLFDNGDRSRFMKCEHYSSVRDGEVLTTDRSMRDANIVPNNYNDYKTFFTPSAAYKYISNTW